MEINLIGPINSLGYGAATYNILKALDKAGHKVSLFPIGNVSWPATEESTPLVNRTRENALSYNSNAPGIRIWHQWELDMFPGKGLHIGWPIFELDKLTDREKHHLNSLDAIFVCSAWAKSVLEGNGVTVPTYVVPLGVDNELFYYDSTGQEARQYWNKDTTIFINVGKWEVRKGHDELVAAFNMAFKPGDNVELWMMNDNPFLGADGNYEWRKKYAYSAMGPHVKFFDRLSNHGDIRKLYAQADCGIFPAKAEGWCLPALESLACGNHIIATNYSGHTEFLNSENALLLDSTGKELAQDGKWFHGQGGWTTFSIEQMVEHMRTIHDKKQSGQLSYNAAGVATAKHFSWANTVNEIVSGIASAGATQQ